jgi:cytoskeleton-associated protein 5
MRFYVEQLLLCILNWILMSFFFLVRILNLAGHFFKKTVSDSNAPVQEKALDALIAYLRAADADAGR